MLAARRPSINNPTTKSLPRLGLRQITSLPPPPAATGRDSAWEVAIEPRNSVAITIRSTFFIDRVIAAEVVAVVEIRLCPGTIAGKHPGARHSMTCAASGDEQCRAAHRLTWRNWQTRTAQDRMGKPVEVRVLS